MNQKPKTLALLVVAGSAGTTLTRIADAYVRAYPGTRIVPLDIERLVYDAGRRDAVSYEGPGALQGLASAGKSGGLSSIVSTLRRGPKWSRPLLDLAFAMVRAMRPISPSYRAQARQLLREQSVDAVLTCNDVNTGMRSVLDAARAEGIPTILAQEGAFCTIERRRRRLIEAVGNLRRALGRDRNIPVRDTYGMFGHERVLVASSYYSDRFVKAGIERDALRIVGVPRFDDLVLHPARRVKSGLPRVTYLFQPFLRQERVGEGAMATLEALIHGIALAQQRHKFIFSIKLHPRADPDTIRHVSSIAGHPVELLDAHASLKDVLASTDVAIGHYSTALLEALVLDVPVVCVPIPEAQFAEPEEAAKQAWFVGSGLPWASEPALIAERILSALEGRRRNLPEGALSSEVGRLDGAATNRAVAAIAELLGEHVDESGGDLRGTAAVELAEMKIA